MINDPLMKADLARMTGVETLLTGGVVGDYKLVGRFKGYLNEKSPYHRLNATLSLVYLQLFHPSDVVRHEAAFTLGVYGDGSATSFLRDSALLDPSPVVRHEACLALDSPSSLYAENNRRLLTYIAENDPDVMVRDSALIALHNLANGE